MKEMMFSKL